MITITFNDSTNEASAFGLTQWDKGQKLKIIWADMPENFQVHFASRSSDEAIVTQAQGQSGETVVDIPDELLKNSEDIYAWIYLTENSDAGESVKRAVLYVRPRAKPHTLVDELEMTQQEILENILSDIKQNIQYIKENGADAEYLPDYVTEEVERVLSKVSEYKSENSLVFIASSDAHLKSGDYNSETGIRHLSQAMRLICERYPMDFFAYLGDMTSGGTGKDIAEAKNEIMRVNAALHPSFQSLISFFCQGAEDNLLKSYYRNGTCITQTELFNLILRRNRDAALSDELRLRGYFFRDIDDIKVRVICLNTSDTCGEALTPSSETAVMSSAQLQWLCESLDLSAKEDSENWGIILLGHHPLNMIDKFPLAVGILEAYISGEAINTLDVDGTNIVYDFEGKNQAKIFAQFHGHLHNFKVSFIADSSIPLICIPNAGFYNNNFYTADSYTQAENLAYSENLTYNKTVNSSEDTAFCVIVIDKTSGKIYAVHYGAGVDRIIDGNVISEDSSGSSEGDNETDSDENNSGETGEDGENESSNASYTNLVPESKTSSGVVYNTNGYTDGYKLNSQGEIGYGPGYTHTGFIDISYTDTVRIGGGTYDGTAGNYILVYDSSYNLLWVATLKTADDSEAGICYADGVITFNPSQVQTGNLENMAYIRVSTVGLGSELIVTRNEEITDEASGDISDPVVSYTNILQYAADESGNIYGTDGYSDNIQLASEGEEQTANGYAVSGYLYIDSDAVIRTKGLSFDGGEGCCLCLYNSNYELIKCISLTAASDSANAIVYSDNIHTFTPADSESDLSGMAYFRISGIGSGSEMIITYCEEIE